MNTDPASPGSPSAPTPGLRRALGLPALVLYGIILIQPTAPMPIFGAAVAEGQGHVVTAVLIGMIGMLFTAVSYGRMANAYPTAGSAYAYVRHEIHPAAGYLVGWAIIFDYVMNPTICAIWCAQAAQNIHHLHFGIYETGFVLLFTALNLRGIETSARLNAVMAAGLGVVILLFLGAAVHYLQLHPPAGAAAWIRPFYDPQTCSVRTVGRGAALAVLTYIGFDGISTLSEEVRNPRRNILLATVLVCLLTGVLAAIQVYAGQLIWPELKFPDVDTAFSDVAGRAGGRWLYHTVNAALLLATIGSGVGAQLGAGRLLYGMGRDNAIPRRFFAAVTPKTQIPANNILLVGALTGVGALVLTYGLGAEMLNFGALLAFMGVNAASFMRHFVRDSTNRRWGWFVPLAGFVVCLALWLSLSWTAMICGGIWLTTGILYGTWRTRGFTKPLGEDSEAG